MKKKYLVYATALISALVISGCGNNVASQIAQVSENTTVEEPVVEENKNDENKNEEEKEDKKEEVTETTESNTEETNNEENAETEENVDNKEIEETEETEESDTPSIVDQPTVEISLDGLSTESVGWGSGGDVNSENIPVGCTMYQDKYGHLSADFVRIDTDDVFLTFDEGYEYPSANSPTGNTAKILDTLKEKGATGVFFITLPYAKENPDLVRRMIDEGHIVGNHSVTHPGNGLPSLGSVEAQQEELMGVHKYVQENFGYTMKLFRYPTGAFSEQSLAIVNNLGYRSVFWSFAHRDWYTDDQPDPTESLQKMVDSLHPGAIYLLHGVSDTNVAVLGDFIDAIREKGYTVGKYY